MFNFVTKVGGWAGTYNLRPQVYDCAFCGSRVSSDRGFQGSIHSDGSGAALARCYICPDCKALTYFDMKESQFPAAVFGKKIEHLPEDISALYREACTSASMAAHSASVMVCRKILMNISVSKGAKTGESFQFYVNYLDTKNYIPPDGKDWVDYIRQLGNEANHEIHVMKEEDSRSLIVFIEMLLKFVFEFPKLIPPRKIKE